MISLTTFCLSETCSHSKREVLEIIHMNEKNVIA